MAAGPAQASGLPEDEVPEYPASPPAESHLERIFNEINLARTDPTAFAAKLEALKDAYDADNVFSDPEAGTAAATHEGWAAVSACVDDLKARQPVDALQWRGGIAVASQEHADFLSSSDSTGHTGDSGSRAADRMRKYGTWWELAGEVMAYRESSAFANVRQMLVCDGEQSRIDRQTLLNPAMAVCGVGHAEHPTLRSVVVVNLSCGFSPLAYSQPTTVSCDGKLQDNPAFSRVLDSIPLMAVHEDVETALAAGQKVDIDYVPGGHATWQITAPDGKQTTKYIEWTSDVTSADA